MKEPLSTDATYRLLIQSITDYAIYLLSPDGIVTNWNPGAQRAKGYTADEVVGTHFSRFYTPEDRARQLPAKALATALTEGVFQGEGWRVRKDGTRFWAQVTLAPVYGRGGELIGFSKVTRDRTEHKHQLDELQEAKETLDLALSNMSEGLCLFNAKEEVVLANAQFEDAMSFKHGTVLPGMNLRTMIRERLRDSVRPKTLERMVERELTECRLRLNRSVAGASLERQWAGRTLATNHRLLPGGGWVTTVRDVTDRKLIEQRIVHMAHHDALTELPNRATFRKQLEAKLRKKAPCALLYLDLDRFKPINDTLGHAAGDRVLQVTGTRILSLLRKGDLSARLGGDEFAILLSGCGAADHAEKIAKRISMELEHAIPVGTSVVKVGVSVGMALAPLHGTDAETLLRCADLALYQAKQDGRGCCRLYDEMMQSTVQHRRDLEQDLRLALTRDEFSLHYQPIVDVKRGVVRSFEALLRWESPTRGKVSPADFIPFAEEIGLMPQIGDWVMRTACREAAGWQSGVCVSVNLSPTQFRDPQLPRKVSALLEECGLPAHRLELEITETAMIGDITGARAILTELRNRGIQIALDDFGTGYSSLSFLRNFPFTRIKIDRSFVQDLGSKPESMAIIRAVTGLCQGLGVAATAEGVETEEQMALLQGQGCVEVQGYLIQRPATAQEAANWLVRYQTQPAMAERPLALTA